jgi:hypothetical protein
MKIITDLPKLSDSKILPSNLLQLVAGGINDTTIPWPPPNDTGGGGGGGGDGGGFPPSWPPR